MNHRPKVSVIMPSLNVENYIEECLSSVLCQTLDDIEIICVDAQSTDQTLNIIKKLQKEDNRIKIVISDRKSYGYQVNLGLRESKGKYVSIVETDDYIDREMLEKLYAYSQNGRIDIIKGNFYHLNDYDEDNVEKIKDLTKRDIPSGKIFRLVDEPLFLDGHPSIWAGIYSRDFLEKNNIHFLEVSKGGWVDNPFLFETAINAESIIYLDETLYYYRTTNPNSSTNDFGDNTLPMKRILDIFDVLRENDVQDREIIKVFYIRLFRYIEIILDHNGNDIDSLDYDTCFYIQKALRYVDEDMVQEELNRNFKVLYYKFLSPLLLLRFEEEYEDKK